MLFRKKINADSFVYSDPGGRKENEDSALILTGRNGLLAVVADGLGGHGGGKTASQTAVDIMQACFKRDASMEPEAFSDWIGKANQAVLSQQTPECEMKTTLVVLRLSEQRAAWAHLGDSRLYHFIDGVLAEQTVDHSVSQMAVFRGEITQDQIRFHEDRNRVLRALGREKRLEPEIKAPTELGSGKHAFLLCSDGFWEYVLENEMEERLRMTGSAEEWVRSMQLILSSRVKPGNDNNTAAAVILDV